MRLTLTSLLLVVLLGVTLPAEAQLRKDAHTAPAPVKLYDQGGAAFSLNKFFSPEHFRMSHSFVFSSSSFGSLGMYTNSMQWQFNQKLAARVDVAVAYQPNQGATFGNDLAFRQNGPQVFLRNAEVAYRPSERMQLHLSIRQSPYGAYASPYGYYGNPYGYHNRFQSAYGSNHLFWKDAPR